MKRDEERREYEGDVFYEAWRRGLNPDRAVECAYDCFNNRKTVNECVSEHERKVNAERAAHDEENEESAD